MSCSSLFVCFVTDDPSPVVSKTRLRLNVPESLPANRMVGVPWPGTASASHRLVGVKENFAGLNMQSMREPVSVSRNAFWSWAGGDIRSPPDDDHRAVRDRRGCGLRAARR